MFGLLRQRKVLTERQAELLERERGVLERLRETLRRFGGDVAPGDLRTLNETIAHLEELFLLVVAGEFNSGKSSFINAMLGDRVLPEGVTPTTDRITLLRYGPEPREYLREEFLLERAFPADILRRIAVVDTPGTNAIIRRHEELTREFIPRADLVLFVTSADRPFTESERAFLEAIREWGKKVLFVLNKVDLLSPDEQAQVIAFIKENVRDLLGFTPEVFAVSARLAQRARLAEADGAAWEASGFEAFERYVVERLDEAERVRLKLLNPIGVAQRLTDKYLGAVEARLQTLQQDVATLENIDRQLDLFRDDLTHDFAYHLSGVDNVLHEFELRGMRFFDETIRLGNIWHLRRTDEVKAAFEEEVVADVPQQIEQRLHQLIDWMIEKNLRLWQAIMDYLQRNRIPEYGHGLIGDVGGSFEYNRGALLESVLRQSQKVVANYDQKVEAEQMVEDVRGALAATALTEIGAVGIGALLAATLPTLALDITGVLAAGVLAIGGLYVIPNKRRQLKTQFRDKIVAMREQLSGTMRRQFDAELDQMIARVREALGPYTRFIRSQQALLTDLQREFSDVDVDLGRLRAEIGA